jgi:hypothetical protein
VFAYPGKGKLLGEATGFEAPSGPCSDKKGDVYVTDFNAGTITEFAYGSTTPMRTLSDTTGSPDGCSVNPKTGDLAVTNWDDTSGSGGVSCHRTRRADRRLRSAAAGEYCRGHEESCKAARVEQLARDSARPRYMSPRWAF